MLVTSTLQVAVLLPSSVVTVTVVSPAALPSIVPSVPTEAISGLLLFHVIFLFVALAGAIVAVSFSVSPMAMVLSPSSVTPVTATLFTVTAQVAVLVASAVEVTVIVAEPALTPVTFPAASTVTISSSLLSHFRV